MHLQDIEKNSGFGAAAGAALVVLCARSNLVGAAGAVRADTSVPSESVYVDVCWSGWQVRLVANGWLGFVATEPRDDLKHVVIAQPDAVAMIDGLVTIGGLQLPERYPSTEESISLTPEGRLELSMRQTMDGPETMIRLHVVDQDVSVRWSEPSQVVPRELRDWVAGFKVLAEAKLIGVP